MPAGLAFTAILFAGATARARDTEDQMVQRIQAEQNSVRKAKDEIRLSTFQLSRVENDYSQGRIEDGEKLLATFMATLKSSWKLLHDSGRTAAKRPEGFRELEIALREDARALQDLERVVSYFDRAPIAASVKDLDQLQGQLIHELFPGGSSRTKKASDPPPVSPESADPAVSR